jgi:hypothetical protein
MSISNLFQPNNTELFCDTLTCNNIIVANPIIQPTYYRVDVNTTSPQTITNATITTVLFPNTVVSNNFTPPIGGIYTAPIAGFYAISFTISYVYFDGVGFMQAWVQSSTTTNRYGFISLPAFEASALTEGPPVSGITLGTDTPSLTGTAIIKLALGETFQVFTYQNSGGVLQINFIAAAKSLISINFLHP